MNASKVWGLAIYLMAICFNCHCSPSVTYKFFRAIYGINTKSSQPPARVVTHCSEYLCYMSCGLNDSCQGYNYATEERRCELMLSPSRPRQQQTEQGSIYMERLDKRFCQNQSVCYLYGYGTWDEGMKFCQLLHPAARLIEERSDEAAKRHATEAEAAGFAMYWLAGRRPTAGGRYEFYWQSTGDNVTGGRWHDDQPYEGTEDSDCIAAAKRFDYRWEDNPCSNDAMYMCKIDYYKTK